MTEIPEDKDGGPAFPMSDYYGTGLSIRDYFAAQLASGAVFQARFPTIWDQDADWLKAQKLTEINDMSSKIAVVAYALADAMLKARSHDPSNPKGAAE